MTPWCDAHHGVEIFELWDRSSQRNRNRKNFSLLIRGPDGFESWKNGGQKSCDTLPLSGKGLSLMGFVNNVVYHSLVNLSTLSPNYFLGFCKSVPIIFLKVYDYLVIFYSSSLHSRGAQIRFWKYKLLKNLLTFLLTV